MLHVNGDVNAMPRKVGCKLTIGGNTITDIKMLTYASDWSGDITIGQVVSSYITATIPTPGFALTGANVSHSMSIGSPAEWVQIGQYTVEENSVRHRQGYTSFTAYDKLHNAVNTFTSSSTSLQAICNEVCAQIGITSTTLPISFTITEGELNGYTQRDVLGFIAAMCGKNAYVSPTGLLELRWFASSGYTADNTRANVPYIGENNCTVSRLICQNANGVITSGSGQGIYFTCPIMTQEWLNWLQGQLSGFTYRKADVDIPFGNFCLQSGDVITVSTTGNNLTVPIMANSWSYDGGLSSSVTSYGVSDYQGTANNAERSATAQRVQGIIDAKKAEGRELQQYNRITQERIAATDLITGASGGYIKINFGGDGKTAEQLFMDQPSYSNALNVWAFNQNGLGHMQRANRNLPFEPMNVALTRDGWVVAERIAGEKIIGVKFENTAAYNNASQILIEDGCYEINQVYNDTVFPVGRIKFIPASGYYNTDTLAIEVETGKNVTIGDTTNPKFVFVSDGSSPDMFRFYGVVTFFEDISLANGHDIIMDGLGTSTNSLLDKIADLESRLAALENA